MAPTVSKTPQEAGLQITRDNYSWSSTLGTAPVPVTYGFRLSPPPYNDDGHDNQNTFSAFNKFQIDAADLAARLWQDVANISLVRVGAGDIGTSAYTDSATILFANYYAPNDGYGA